MTDSKRTVLVPVTATLLVPVDVDLPPDVELVDDDVLGAAIANIGERDDCADILAALNAAMQNNESVTDALASLLAGVMSYQRNHPTVRGRYTPHLGLVPEQDI